MLLPSTVGHLEQSVPDDQSVNKCLIDECPKLARYGQSAAGYVLQHEDADELLSWIDPEMRAGPTAPTMKAHRSHHARLGNVHHHTETQPKAKPNAPQGRGTGAGGGQRRALSAPQRFHLVATCAASLLLWDDGDAVDLDGGRSQAGLHGRAGGIGLFEVLPVHLVELGKVVEIRQEGADLDHVFPRGAGGLQDGADVPKGQLGLLSKAAQSELAGLWVDRSLSRDIDLGSIRHDGVRVWASWLGTFFGKNLSPHDEFLPSVVVIGHYVDHRLCCC